MNKGNTFKRVCRYCGREFDARSPTGQVCDDPECQAEHRRESLERRVTQRREGKFRADRKDWYYRSTARQRWGKSKESIEEIQRQADEKGMTYGQYVAWLYQQGIKK